MKRLLHLVLFAAWILGAVTGGVTVGLDAPTTDSEVRVAVKADWARLTVRAEQVVLAVGRGPSSWRAAAPLPTIVTEWLRRDEGASPETHGPPLQKSNTVVPL